MSTHTFIDIPGNNVDVHDGSGNPITSTVDGAKRGLDVNVNGGDITIENATLAVEIDAADGDNIAIKDVTGTNALSISAAGAAKVDGSAVTQPISAVALPLPSGAATLAEQQTQTASLSVIDDWDESDRAKVNPIVGQAGVQGASGVVSANTQRVVLATDVALPAGANALGSVKLDSNLLSPFGDLMTAPLFPGIQLDFIYGINTQTMVTTTANGATIDTSAARLRLQTGTNVAGSAIFNSRKLATYRPGQGIVARFTGVFTTGVANSTQIIGVGTSVDGYFFGFNDASFGILHRNNSVDTWTAQASWNGDKCNGTGPSGFTYNPTNGCVFQIKYPFLGYGDITFWAQDPTTGGWILCHTNRYNNSSASVQVTNPTLFAYAQAVNSGNNTNLTMFSGSMGIFLCGPRVFATYPKWAADNRKTGVTAETNIISLRNATTYNGVTNRSSLRLNSMSVGSGTGTTATIRLRLGATLGGAPSFAPINGSTGDNGVTITSGNSSASTDIAGTTSTGGTYIFNITLGNNGSQLIDLTPLDIFVAPGETLTCGAVSNAATEFNLSFNWSEDI